MKSYMDQHLPLHLLFIVNLLLVIIINIGKSINQNCYYYKKKICQSKSPIQFETENNNIIDRCT